MGGRLPFVKGSHLGGHLVGLLDVMAPMLGAVVLVLVGCDGGSGPAFASHPCKTDADNQRPVTLDDATLGYSGHDVANAFATNGVGLLQWFDESQTILHIDADVSEATVDIDEPPPYRGFCYPSMTLNDVSFAITTDDGRLAEREIPHASMHVGNAGLSISPGLRVDLSQLQGSLVIPADWLPLPEPDQQELKFVVNSRVNLDSPYCQPGELPDSSPTSECTAWSGKIIFSTSSGNTGSSPVPVTELVGWWTWQ